MMGFNIHRVCVFVVCIGLAFCRPSDHIFERHHKDESCGYQSCNPVKAGMINVHLVPHTHDDVGWLKTVDQYFYGAKDNIQQAGVQYLIDGVIKELQRDPTRRFIYVEIAFFKRWWDEQDAALQATVKQLVNEGRLEFILGGWSMNDEASTYYGPIIDQHTLGFDFLKKTFGECGRPRVAWQIDPFGHSREQASLFAQMGFDGLFFGRLDFEDKANRLAHKTMEMVWKGSDNLGEKAYLFTGALYNGYNPPDGFCFDIYCGDEPIMDDQRLHDFNVDEKVKLFLNKTMEQSRQYATSHIIMTMGSDFQYGDASRWYKNLDKLIKYVNDKQSSGSNVNLLYSTPSCYTYQLNKAGLTWTTKSDDFFPYAHRPHSFWTGYFTSRASLKGYVRDTNKFLQVCKQLNALEQLGQGFTTVNVLKEAMGVSQHHDAVSGTEKQAVAYDYEERLSNGRKFCQKTVNDAYNKLFPVTGEKDGPQHSFCSLTNITYCDISEHSDRLQVTVYNPLGWPVSNYITIPVSTNAYRVLDNNGEQIVSQVLPVEAGTMRIPERSKSIAHYRVVFEALAVPPLGFLVYFVERSNSIEDLIKGRTDTVIPTNEDTSINNGILTLTFDGTSGLLKNVMNERSGLSINLSQQFLLYRGHPGNNSKPDFQASGAYIFRPNETEALPCAQTSITSVNRGDLVQEVHQRFGSYITQVVRLYKNIDYIEFEWTVGSIPIQDHIGKEIITRYQTDFTTGGLFYTDANGREFLERKRNFRPTWKLNQTEPVAGNYYPINSKAYIRNQGDNMQLSVVTDRSEGGSSVQDGNLEIMLHRRLLFDDALGVGEPLNETGSDHKGLIVRGKHFVSFGRVEYQAKFYRQRSLTQSMTPSLSYTNLSVSYEEWKNEYKTQYSALGTYLPPNIHLLTLEEWSNGTYLMRLEHFYEKGEDEDLSKPATVDLTTLFLHFDVTSAVELTLGANLKLADLHRLQWKIQDSERDTTLRFQHKSANALSVTLDPMEIKTLQVTMVPKSQNGMYKL